MQERTVEMLVEDREWRWVFISGALLLIIISIPFVIAYSLAATSDAVFSGVLVNPLDGASYLAKMYQGQTGSWLFRLPYTPEKHQGVFLFTFYLALGHLARLLNLPLPTVFHLARLIGSMILFVVLYRLVADWTNDTGQRRITWGLAIVSGGLGWLALLVGGHIAPDLLTLPEAFPIQATYANPHFPWSIAIALWVVHVLVTQSGNSERLTVNIYTVSLALGTLALVSMSPFVLGPIGIGYAAMCAWVWQRERAFPRSEVTWGSIVLLAGLPLAAYNLWATSGANPALQAWMAQNSTPSPPVWDYLIAFGPLLALALTGLVVSLRSLQREDVFLIGWLAGIMVLLYAPLGLQRRFAMGLVVPLAIYAGRGLWRVIIPRMSRRWQVFTISLAMLVFTPTTVLAIVLPLVGATNAGRDYFFIQHDEKQALDWLEAEAEDGALVLASPSQSLFIPLRGLRVVYAHPFETLNAEARRQAVLSFYEGSNCDVVSKEGVDYIMVGPRERELEGSGTICPIPGVEVFRAGEVVIYAVSGQ